MKESLVQWTLLNNQQYLSKCLDFDIAKKIGQEISTKFGRIDFILENESREQLVVELETVLNTQSKLDYCLHQVSNYQKVRFVDSTEYCILFADETPSAWKKKVHRFGREKGVLIKYYSLKEVKELYSDTVRRLSLNVGLAFPNPKNYTICFLRWLNKILLPFWATRKNVLSNDELSGLFGSGKTNYNCHKRLALDFEMLEKQDDDYYLTRYGKAFIDNFSPYINATKRVSTVDLTNEQKRLLLNILTNGNWEEKVHKINIYWFMRFIEVTDGKWLPNSYHFDDEKLKIAQGLFNVTYKHRTMKEFLTWCSNYCIELGLIKRIKENGMYDKIILTPLGVEVNNIFSMDLTLKKSRMNLSFKYAE